MRIEHPDYDAISRRVAMFRNILGLTRSEIAHRLGLSVRKLRIYEQQGAVVSALFLLKAYKVFKIDPLWILTGEGNPVRSSIEDNLQAQSEAPESSLIKEANANRPSAEPLATSLSNTASEPNGTLDRLVTSCPIGARRIPKVNPLSSANHDWIRHALKKKGLTLTDISAQTSCSNSAATYVSQGKTRSARIESAISEAIGFSVQEIWGYRD